MNYRQLKTALESLTDEQLEMPVRITEELSEERTVTFHTADSLRITGNYDQWSGRGSVREASEDTFGHKPPIITCDRIQAQEIKTRGYKVTYSEFGWWN